MRPTRRLRSMLGLLLALVFSQTASAAGTEPAPVITVLAAASLGEVLEETSREFTRRTGVPVRHSFAASSQLARQIEAGARVDVFISADELWMDRLREQALIENASLRRLAGNRLVVIQLATPSADIDFDPTRREHWLRALSGGRLATGDPDFVPLGRYAREALASFGMWSAIEPNLARAENARVAMALVVRGEARLGIVYATDAMNERAVRIVHSIDPSRHSPIRYPAALTRTASSSARDYLDFLASADGQKYFAKKGFIAAR